MKFYFGVTDNDWYNYLSTINPEDINFWQPGGNSYDCESNVGKLLWNKIEILLQRYLEPLSAIDFDNQLIQEPEPLYGKSILTKVRLGQGAFRVLVTDAYTKMSNNR